MSLDHGIAVEDLYVGMALMAAGTLVLAGVTMRLAWSASKKALDVLALVVIAAIVVFVFLVRERLVMARLLPYSNLVVVGNWLPLMAGILAGLMVPRLRGRRSAQILWGSALLLTALFAIVDPLRGNPPLCQNRWDEVCKSCEVAGREFDRLEICRQTSQVTCSPAAACTLLAWYGIKTTETEMALECLTRNGTTWQGLYRGMVLATWGSEWQVEVFNTDFETLMSWPGPKLLFVELVAGSDYDPIYVDKYGWAPGRRHTVVLYDRVGPDRVRVGDPSIGVENWSHEDIETLWHGRGMRLVKRDG